MDKKRSRLGTRLQAWALTLAMTLSLLSGLSLGTPPLTAMAANDGDVATSGGLKILMLDSSVPNADSNVRAETVNSDPLMNELGLWSDTVKWNDLVTKGQGLARMERRNLQLFDVTDMPGASNMDPNKYFQYSELVKTGSGAVNKGRLQYEVGPLNSAKPEEGSALIIDGKENGFKENHIYVITENPTESNLYSNDYGYLPNVENGSNGEKAWQLIFKWADGANLEIGLDAHGQWSHLGTSSTNNDLFLMGNNQQPLHNEVMRGGFKFHVQDVDLMTDGKTQGTDDVSNSYFAIFNVSDLAMAPNTFDGVTNGTGCTYPTGNPKNERQARSGKSKVDETAGFGYVTVYRNANVPGGLNDPGKKMFFPAYSVDEVMSAWRAYLTDCANTKREATVGAAGKVEAMYISGLYGVDKTVGNNNYKIAGTNQAEKDYGLFVMGKNNDGLNIVPCMVVKAKNGIVDTGAYALPVGNYLVLQVKAGEGYYIDENFAPIVSIGPWYSLGSGTAYPSIPGYITNTGTALDVRNMGLESAGNHAVAYVPAQSKTSVDISGTTGFYMTASGISRSGKAMTYGSDDTYVSEHKYHINPDGQENKDKGANKNSEAVGSRREPLAGSSRFNAYDAIVRGGVQFYLADSDDVLSDAAQAANPYIAIPQGDGDLAGAKFRLYNKPSQKLLDAWTFENTKANTSATQAVGLGDDKVIMSFDSDSYKEYTAEYDSKLKQYVLRIPVDDLPFGVFRLTQVMTGKGYGGETEADKYVAEEHVELTVRYIGVWQENHVTSTYACGVSNEDGSSIDSATQLADTLKKYRIPADTGSLYLPQKLVTGGMVISARSTTGDDTASIRVQVYNISEYYTYVDKDGSGDKRYETKKKEYNSSIKGSKITTVDGVKNVLSGWDASCVADFTSTVGDLSRDVEAAGIRLPYGTYLLAVTDLGSGLTVLGDPLTTGKIDKEDKDIKWEVIVGDKSEIPEVSTILADTLYDIDSIAVDKDRSMTDYVSLGNLKAGESYVVYGMLVDQSDGSMLEGSSVAYATASGYVSADTTPVTPDATARQYYEAGRAFSEAATRVGQGGAAYAQWLMNVQSYAQGRQIPGFLDKVMSALRAYREDMDDSTAYNGIMSILGRYGMGEAGSSVLDGTALVKLEYPHVPTDKLEGTTVVGYVYVCKGAKPEANALAATSPSELTGAISPYMVGMYANLNDEAETGYIPSLDIEAKASYTAGKFLDPTETVTGTVTYGNVEPGNSYRIDAILKDMAGKDIPDADGKPLVVTVDFVAKDSKGYENMTFDGLDVDAYNGQRLTVYATLYRTITQGGVTTPYRLVAKGDGDSMGWTATDPDPGKNQVDVRAPLVTTVLTDKNGNKDVNFDIKVSLTDRVTYRDLIPGEKYKSVLTLVGKDGKELFDDEGKKLTASIEFTASAAEQTVDVPIEFMGTKLQGSEIVAFNDLYHMSTLESLVAFEHNLEAASQTITAGGEDYKIHFTTSVTDDITNTQYTRAVADATLTDSVHIRNLEPNTKYVLVTELARASNGNLVNQFQPINTSVTSDEDGTIKTDIPFKANLGVFGGQTLVVFQTLYDEKETKVIAEHRDRTDMNQRFYVSDIDTVLTGENGRSKKISPDLVEHKTVRNVTGENGELKTQTIKTYNWETTLADQVYYSNLIPGNTYMVTSTIMTQDGRTTVGTSNQTFTPRSESGVFTVYLDLDVTDFMGKKLVAYETITDTYTNTVIMSHEDLSDEDQTVEITSVEEEQDDEDVPDADAPNLDDPNNPNNPNNQGGNPGKDIQTGVAERYGLYFAIAAILALLAAVGGVFYWKRRRG